MREFWHDAGRRDDREWKKQRKSRRNLARRSGTGPAARGATGRNPEFRRAPARCRPEPHRASRHQPAAREIRRAVDRAAVHESVAARQAPVLPQDRDAQGLSASRDPARRDDPAVRALQPARVACGQVELSRAQALQRFFHRHRTRRHGSARLYRCAIPRARPRRTCLARRLSDVVRGTHRGPQRRRARAQERPGSGVRLEALQERARPMNLIALLLALIIERLAAHWLHLREPHWFDGYFEWTLRRFSRTRGARAIVIALIFTILPVLPIAAIAFTFSE